jgi:hypothetical protein
MASHRGYRHASYYTKTPGHLGGYVAPGRTLRSAMWPGSLRSLLTFLQSGLHGEDEAFLSFPNKPARVAMESWTLFIILAFGYTVNFSFGASFSRE